VDTPRGRTKAPAISTRDLHRCLPFDHALAGAGDGVGFVLTGGLQWSGGWVVALDVDECLEAGGQHREWWGAMLAQLPPAYRQTYTEETPSGRGLRIWLRLGRLPMRGAPMLLHAPGFSRVPGEKRPGIQVFGVGAAGYVTVTGRRTPESGAEITVVESLDDLYALFPQLPDRAVGPMPAGYGPPPTHEDIEAALPDPGLLDARWEGRYASASEAYAALVVRALTVARRHADVVVEWLLTTAWGQGRVDSREPARYGRRSWVEREVGRLLSKAGAQTAGASVFAPLPLLPPPAEGEPRRTNRWMEAREFASGNVLQQFLAHGLLPRVGIGQVFGDPGCGKTPVAISLALHVAAGRTTWCGHDLDRQGAVAYLIGEDAAGIRARMIAECQRLDLDFASLPVVVSRTAGQLSSPEDVEAWIRDALLLHPEGYALVVVDTLARNFGEGDENATKDIGQVVQGLQRLADALGGLCAAVHHTGHRDKERARGAMALLGALDVSLRVTREGREITIETTKAKNWATPDAIRATLTPVVLGQDAKGRPVTAITLDTEGQSITEALDAATAAATDPHVVRLLRAVQDAGGASLPRRTLASQIGASEHAVRVRLDELVAAGLVNIERSEKARQPGAYSLTETGARALEYSEVLL
jgi:DNA-binding MarR family transcriptional regulator